MGLFGRPRQGPSRAEIANARRDICYQCPTGQLRFVAGRPNCRACGCFIEAKSFLISQRCPHGHWQRSGV